MPRGDEGAAAEQGAGALAGDVEVRGVRHVVAIALEVPRHQRLVPQHLSAAVVARVRAVEGDLHRECAGRVVKAGPAPGVVGLGGEHGGVHQQIRRAVVLDHQRDQHADPVVTDDPDQIEAAEGVLRNRHRERRRPRAVDEPRGGVGRAGGLRSGLRRSAGDRARSVAAVPADAVQRPARLAAPVGAHHQLDRVAGLGADPVRVRFDLTGPGIGEAPVPRRVAAQLVLRGDRIGIARPGRWPAGVVRRAAVGDRRNAAVILGAADERQPLSTAERKDDPYSDNHPPHGRKLGSTASGSKPRETRINAASVCGRSE